MEQQKAIDLNPRVFYFRAKERGLPESTSSYVDVRLNYRNWHRFFFRLKEKFVAKDFFDLYKDTNFDIIHAHTLFSNGYIAYQAKKRLGIPYIVAVRDMDVNIFLKYRLTLRKLGIDILKEAEKIIFLSGSYREHVLSKYIPEKYKVDFFDKSIIVPNGIDNFFLENRKFRESTSTHTDFTINLLTVGYVNKRKNQLTVCKAVQQLNNEGVKADYTIIGKVLDQKIYNKIKGYPFVNYIPFLSKEKLIDEYRKADLFVMPSLTETFGLTYVEAMTQGLPVIYSKSQGFDGQFDEGVVGYSVDSYNVEEIKNRILDVMKDYSNISRNCVDLSDKYNWKDIAEKYKVLYQEIVYPKK